MGHTESNQLIATFGWPGDYKKSKKKQIPIFFPLGATRVPNYAKSRCLGGFGPNLKIVQLREEKRFLQSVFWVRTSLPRGLIGLLTKMAKQNFSRFWLTRPRFWPFLKIPSWADFDLLDFYTLSCVQIKKNPPCYIFFVSVHILILVNCFFIFSVTRWKHTSYLSILVHHHII